MAASYIIPAVINDYNLYNDGNVLVGHTGEVAIPAWESVTEDINGVCMAGGVTIPIIGKYAPNTMDIPYRVFDREAASLLNANQALSLMLRGAQQVVNRNTLALEVQQVRIAIRGFQTGFNPGTYQPGAANNGSVTVSLASFMMEIAGKKVVEVDKFNWKCLINGIDVLEKIRSMV